MNSEVTFLPAAMPDPSEATYIPPTEGMTGGWEHPTPALFCDGCGALVENSMRGRDTHDAFHRELGRYVAYHVHTNAGMPR